MKLEDLRRSREEIDTVKQELALLIEKAARLCAAAKTKHMEIELISQRVNARLADPSVANALRDIEEHTQRAALFFMDPDLIDEPGVPQVIKLRAQLGEIGRELALIEDEERMLHAKVQGIPLADLVAPLGVLRLGTLARLEERVSAIEEEIANLELQTPEGKRRAEEELMRWLMPAEEYVAIGDLMNIADRAFTRDLTYRHRKLMAYRGLLGEERFADIMQSAYEAWLDRDIESYKREKGLDIWEKDLAAVAHYGAIAERARRSIDDARAAAAVLQAFAPGFYDRFAELAERIHIAEDALQKGEYLNIVDPEHVIARMHEVKNILQDPGSFTGLVALKVRIQPYLLRDVPLKNFSAEGFVTDPNMREEKHNELELLRAFSDSLRPVIAERAKRDIEDAALRDLEGSSAFDAVKQYWEADRKRGLGKEWNALLSRLIAKEKGIGQRTITVKVGGWRNESIAVVDEEMVALEADMNTLMTEIRKKRSLFRAMKREPGVDPLGKKRRKFEKVRELAEKTLQGLEGQLAAAQRRKEALRPVVEELAELGHMIAAYRKEFPDGEEMDLSNIKTAKDLIERMKAMSAQMIGTPISSEARAAARTHSALQENARLANERFEHAKTAVRAGLLDKKTYY